MTQSFFACSANKSRPKKVQINTQFSPLFANPPSNKAELMLFYMFFDQNENFEALLKENPRLILEKGYPREDTLAINGQLSPVQYAWKTDKKEQWEMMKKYIYENGPISSDEVNEQLNDIFPHGLPGGM